MTRNDQRRATRAPKLKDFDGAIRLLNDVLARENPEHFTSSWISKRSPRVYHFARRNLRTPSGAIDWDAVTVAIDSEFQRRWMRRRRIAIDWYENMEEVAAALESYQSKLYTFIAFAEDDDREVRNRIAVVLVRLAQNGNHTAQQELTNLLLFTIDIWIERYWFMSRWQYNAELLQLQIEACIRRYRFTGSFLSYLFTCLMYAARGLKPVRMLSLDRPLFEDGSGTLAENVVEDPATGEPRLYSKDMHFGE